MIRYILPLLVCAICLQLPASGQSKDFSSRQKAQEKTIKAAYKNGKITGLEYDKLMHEQDAIKEAMAKYEADDILTSKEKNALHDKLVRADKRLRRYKTNGEIY